MINPTPNLNGNSAKDFTDAAVALSKALDAVNDALSNIRANVFHGRNYQTVRDAQVKSARDGDDLQLLLATKHVGEIRYLATQIVGKVIDPEVAA